MDKPVNKEAARRAASLLCIIRFIGSCGKNIAAAAFLVGDQGPGFSGAAAHADEDIRPLAAIGTFDLSQSRCVFSFVATIQQYGNPSFVSAIVPHPAA